MAWHSGADIIKDLADLDDFDGFENKDSFSILYSLGRGIKSREKSKYSTAFIDPRTGDTIYSDDTDSDVSTTYYNTKGRGSVLGFGPNPSTQLQKQLRLARPLGSSDEIFESFWRRNVSKTDENAVSASNSEIDSQKSATSNQISDFVFHSSENRKRVIAGRNSKLQSNALISNLSKNLIQSDKNTVKKPNEKNDHYKIQKNNYNSTNSNSDDDDVDGDNDNGDDDDYYCYCDNDDIIPTSVDTPGQNLENATQSDSKKHNCDQSEKLNSLNLQNNTEEKKNYLIANNVDEKIKNKSEIYRKLGERIKTNNRLYEECNTNSIFNLNFLSKPLTSENISSESERDDSYESSCENFTFTDDDFPPLK